jgi:hypothetical protein
VSIFGHWKLFQIKILHPDSEAVAQNGGVIRKCGKPATACYFVLSLALDVDNQVQFDRNDLVIQLGWLEMRLEHL